MNWNFEIGSFCNFEIMSTLTVGVKGWFS